jgi:hypothetical protein
MSDEETFGMLFHTRAGNSLLYLHHFDCKEK